MSLGHYCHTVIPVPVELIAGVGNYHVVQPRVALYLYRWNPMEEVIHNNVWQLPGALEGYEWN